MILNKSNSGTAWHSAA